MNIKGILAAAAVALTVPFAASAAVVEVCEADGTQSAGGPWSVNSLDVFNCDFTTSAVNGSIALDFVAVAVPAGGMASNVNLSAFGGTFTSASLSWFETGGALISTAVAGVGGAAEIISLLAGFEGPAPDFQTLVFEWTGFSNPSGLPVDINIQVAPVPVPAGILLMGTALAGFGALRRKKKAA